MDSGHLSGQAAHHTFLESYGESLWTYTLVLYQGRRHEDLQRRYLQSGDWSFAIPAKGV